MFTYIQLFKLTPEGRQHLVDVPKYHEKIRAIVLEEGGTIETTYAVMGPWDFLLDREVPRQRGRVPRARQDRPARGRRDADVPGGAGGGEHFTKALV